MKYYTLEPSPQLAPYVRCFWVFEGEASDAEPYIYRGYADGCTEIVFHYQSPFDQLVGDVVQSAHSAGIHAHTRRFTRFVVGRSFGIFGCYLYPYALPKLLALPASDFTDHMVDLDDVLGRDGSELEERMLVAATNEGRVAILSTFLEKRLTAVRTAEPLVFASIRKIIDERGLVNVRSLAREHFFSDRQFERKFKEFSGFSPKLYSRINRFQAALKQYGSGKSLTRIAYDCGYYDQSHFINDFREFSGYNPKIYFTGQAEGSEYLEA